MGESLVVPVSQSILTHCTELVAVRIAHIAGVEFVVIGPKARCTFIETAIGQGRSVESLNCRMA